MSVGDGFLQGMDVSKWQATTPDLSGAYFLIARAGIGTKPDAMYATHIAAARKAGIITGSYWFGWGSLSVSDQVDRYIALEGDVQLHALDWESSDGFSAAQAKQFISLYQQRSGKRIALYASESRFRDLGQDWNWIANYSQEPAKAFDIWQYGPYHGADGNLFAGTLADLNRLAGINMTISAGDGINFGVESWLLDGKTPVISIGAPRNPDGSSRSDLRLVLVADSDDVNFVSRTRLTNGAPVPVSDALLAALKAGALPVCPPDTTPYGDADLKTAGKIAVEDWQKQLRTFLGL